MSLAGLYVKFHCSHISCDSAGDSTASVTDPCQGLGCHCTNWHSTGSARDSHVFLDAPYTDSSLQIQPSFSLATISLVFL